MRRLTLIRHGLTEGNVRRWYYGALDLPLCETGKSALPNPTRHFLYLEYQFLQFFLLAFVLFPFY